MKRSKEKPLPVQGATLAARVPAERRKRLKDWLNAHGEMSFQEFLNDAIETILAGKSPVKSASIKHKIEAKKVVYTETELEYNRHAENEEWLEMADFILASKNSAALYGLKSNVLAFLAMIDDDGDGVNDERIDIPRENFAILLTRARSIYAKLKLREKRSELASAAAKGSIDDTGTD